MINQNNNGIQCHLNGCYHRSVSIRIKLESLLYTITTYCYFSNASIIGVKVSITGRRIKNELTQEKLAEAFGVFPQAISRWENNFTYPEITMLPCIANYYNVSIDELMGMGEIRDVEKINSILIKQHKKRRTIFSNCCVHLYIICN